MPGARCQADARAVGEILGEMALEALFAAVGELDHQNIPLLLAVVAGSGTSCITSQCSTIQPFA